MKPQNVRLSVSLTKRSYDALKLLSLARGRPISVVLRDLLDDAADGISASARAYGLAAFGQLTGPDAPMSDAQARLRHRELLAELMEVATLTVARQGDSGGSGRSPATPDSTSTAAQAR